MNDIKHIHLLTLVLVKTLCLNIVNGIRIDLDALALFDQSRKFFLLGLFDLFQSGKNIGIVFEGQKLLQFRGVLLKACADL